jgi:aspartate--ammonia ligase
MAGNGRKKETFLYLSRGEVIMALIIPENYDPHLTVRETQEAIKYIRDTFQKEFGKEMHLERISAPLFVEKSSGLNDDLNGVERPVAFDIKDIPGETIEVVHSLAKWKRMALKRYGFQPGEGLYTNMNAIRRDEELDNLHSCYVDQWDWEKVITKEQRNEETLKETVRTIWTVIKHMEHEVWYKYPQAVNHLPEDIFFITTEELEALYPDKTPKERENAITKEHGCVFLMKIGDKLANGEPHDGRAPDYDDWQLNGDILYWYPLLGCALEISSMGIRVSEESLAEQLKKAGCEERRSLTFHKMLLNGELPYTIGGGIGQSRLCMLLLNRAHVGEVQASLWPEEMRKVCEENNIILL